MSKRIIITALSIIVPLIAGFGYIGANYYSVMADIRESFIAVDESDAYAYGETLFETRGCMFCHTLDVAGATGDGGPSLNEIGRRYDDAFIRQSIVEPNAVIAPMCPEGPCEPDIMPPYGNALDDAQVNALVTYLSAQQ